MKKTAIVLAGIIIMFGLATGWYRHVTAIKTVFASNFSKERLLHMAYGSTEQEARKALGAPLSVAVEQQPEMWVYGRSSEIEEERTAVTSRDIISLDPPPTITFDVNGRVERIQGDLRRISIASRITAGATKTVVESVLGRPLVIRSRARLTEYRYSRPQCSNCNYEDARLWFDDRGRLVDKRFSILWD